MNWLDVVLLLVLAGSVVTSFSTGLAREVVGMVSMVLALVLAIWFYGTAGSFLQPYVSSPGIANFCGFLMVFCGVLILGAILGRLLAADDEDHGIVVRRSAAGRGFRGGAGDADRDRLVLALLAFTPGKAPPNAVVHSKVAPYVIDAARVCRGGGAARVERWIPEELRAGKDDLGQRPEKGHSGIAGCGKGMR